MERMSAVMNEKKGRQITNGSFRKHKQQQQQQQQQQQRRVSRLSVMTDSANSNSGAPGLLQLERQAIDLNEALEESPIFREKIKREEEVPCCVYFFFKLKFLICIRTLGSFNKSGVSTLSLYCVFENFLLFTIRNEKKN
jgi:hypothetical protein